MQIPFYRQSVTPRDKKAVEAILDGSNHNAVEDLEADFEEYIGAEYALATSSGTSALHLAMLAIDLKRGDRVLCSVNSHPSVPEVVRHFDAEPTFIDVDEETFTIDLDKLEAYLEDHKSKKLKAVIVTHVGGQPCDLERLYNIAKIYNVKIVEDAPNALGATYKGDKIGSTGADITCFSFSPHLKRSIVNGGMFVTNDIDLYDRAKLLRNHAITVDEDSLEYIYEVTDIGYNYLMGELEASYIASQLKDQDAHVKRQRAIADIYRSRLKNAEHITLPVLKQDHGYSLFILKIDKNRDSFARELDAKGIESGLHYIPLHLLNYYKTKYELRVNDFPRALRNYQQVLSIPIFADMSDKEIDYLCKSILEITKNRV